MGAPGADGLGGFPGRRLMPAKTRTFIDMLEAALGGAPGNLPPGNGRGG